MKYLKIDGQHFYKMVVNASNKLEQQKEYVNAMNVFPVPDGDTGTNMSMTFKAAVCEIEDIKTNSIGEVSKKLARGALMGARGNSGVILSQIFRGIAKGLEGKDEATVEEFAKSIMEGSGFAYKAVMRPTEGTILTIIKAAGEAAVNSLSEDMVTLMEEVCSHSEVVLNKTPDMLPQLKQAKVVDAGGMGLLILLKGMSEALKDNIEAKLNKEEVPSSNIEGPSVQMKINEADIKFGYCTEFLITGENIKIESFKDELEKLGDSMAVVAEEDFVHIHIHTNEPGVVLSMALKLGELSKIKIENMREQNRNLSGIEGEASYTSEEISDVVEETKKYGFVTVSKGDGIKNIFKDLGVDHVIEGGQTMNPSTQDILDCIEKLNAENIFVLPNNKNIIMAATQAAELANKNVIVIPTTTIPQGITAITMFNIQADITENEETMKESIKNVATGSVTYAVKDTESDGREIKEGNILGLLENKIKEIGTDIYDVCEELIDGMVKDDSELITIFYGEECDEEKVQEFVEKLEDKYSDLDIQCYNGKQPLYYFITSVE